MKEFPNGILSLSNKDIHIWKFEIDKSENSPSSYIHLLDTNEKERASKFRFSTDRDQFLWGRILLKQLLGNYLNINPKSITVKTTADGKPIFEKIEHQQIHFNLSHSHNCIILGFSKSPIGVDIEHVSRKVNIEQICRNHFSDAEQNLIQTTTSTENKESIFFDIWTKKEALIKGIGKGLGIPLQSLNVIDAEGCVKFISNSNIPSLNWYVHTIQISQAYKAAFATQLEDFVFKDYSINR